jgi:hypothetical protein
MDALPTIEVVFLVLLILLAIAIVVALAWIGPVASATSADAVLVA